MDARYEGGVLAMLVSLLDASHLVAFKDIPQEVNRCAAMADLEDVAIYLVDMQQEVLREMTGIGVDAKQESEREYAVEGTMAGRAFQYGQPVMGSRDGRDRFLCWVPLIKGTERLGVLRAGSPGDDPDTVRKIERLASMVALVLLARRRTSDAYPRLLRTKRMEVAAEQEWQLMPPRTYADSDVVISGVMEPAYEVGGDAFDYAMAGDTAHLAVFDSMGHDTTAGIAVNLAMSIYRNRRRRDVDLVETSVEIERILIEQFNGDQYVTGVLATLDTRDGMLRWINRGHPAPIIIRGQRWSTSLKCPPAHPMGTDLGLDPTVCSEQLEPGDRVVFYTDGITEARNHDGQEFGLDQFTDFLIRHHSDQLPTPETLRRLIRSILDHHGGKLTDDATVLLAEWISSEKTSRRRLERTVGLPRF
ncbi:PP2C family protein-serine/threonine phosphatase [Glycomyces arizonensis]|uniref:PP2C family protein-serine/threonine phosphatase n=1 Tax=Glycomyces arizonensis TaxID=256035 RepID=UPI0003FFE9F1|nr:SpoIIE family protein phosphatase [Glycomyces arizonensis]